jgi:hypothetical protein
MDVSYLEAEDAATTHRVLNRLAARSVLEYESYKQEANFSRPLHEVFESEVGNAEQVLYKRLSTSKLRSRNIVA